MRFRSFIGLAVSCLACASSGPSAPAAPRPEGHRAELLALAQKECERDRQMMAMAPEAIAAGCAADVEARWAGAIVESVAALFASEADERVVFATLEKADGGLGLRFPDGFVRVTPEANAEAISASGEGWVLACVRVRREAGRTVAIDQLGPAVFPGAKSP